MGRFFRIKLRFRRFLRRHSWVATIIRSFTIFSIAAASSVRSFLFARARSLRTGARA